MFSKILVPLDGSDTAECVFPYAAEIARINNSKIELALVVEPYEIPLHGGVVFDQDSLRELEQYSKRRAKDYVQRKQKYFQSKGIDVKTTVRAGKIADSLIDYADSKGFDLIVMATHGRSGVSRWLVGSIADKIINSSNIPVLLIRPGQQR